jgi:hypothetical protein
MKYYIAHTTIHDGGHEYGEQILVRADNAGLAEMRAKQELIEIYANPEDYDFIDNKLDLFDQIVEFEDVREIPESDFVVLQNYLYTIR